MLYGTRSYTFFRIQASNAAADPFIDCLSDSKGEPLRFTPNNQPTPPRGDGTQLCYRALPHYEAMVKKRSKDHREKSLKQPKEMTCDSVSNCQCVCKKTNCKICKLLEGKNQPIPIKNEHEFSHLYLQEFYKKESKCSITNLDASAILNILSKSDCFSHSVNVQASKVRDRVRNKWAHAIVENWTPTYFSESFDEISKLAKIMPNNNQLLKELYEDKIGSESLEFPLKNFLLKIRQYRTSVRDGNHSKIQDRLRKLENIHKQEIFVERTFQMLKPERKEENTRNKTSDIEKLVLEEPTTLLKGPAGAGKSLVATKVLQRWADGIILKDITCCLFLSTGSEDKIPLNKIIWDEHKDFQFWGGKDFSEAFYNLKLLAYAGHLAVIIDGLDELGGISHKDIETAKRAALHPPMSVDMKTTCVGILDKVIFTGAKVFATGRNIELINTEILKDQAKMWELMPLTKSDREQMVEMMEPDSGERKRIQEELERVSTVGNNLFLMTPLMTKTVIELSIEKLVDMQRIINSSEIYLMIILKALDYHKDHNTNFTEIDPPEDQFYLEMCLRLCLSQMQGNQNNDNINTIKGIIRNVKDMGQCFETKVFGETIRIPVEFVNKIGIFDYRKEGPNAYLDAIHLSYYEFCAAGALCRNGVDIEAEMSKIKNPDRYEAVAIYLAGLFASNSSIDFLTICKNLCQNFLYLVDNPDHKLSINHVFRSILTYDYKTNDKFDLTISAYQEKIQTSARKAISILEEAVKASGEKVHLLKLGLEVTNVSLKNVDQWNDYQCLSKLFSIMDDEVPHLEITEKANRHTGKQDESLEILLKGAKSWHYVRQADWATSETGLTKLSGNKLNSINSGTADCYSCIDNFNNLTNLCNLLSSTEAWRLDYLDLRNASEAGWGALAKASEKGRIGTLHVSTQVVRQAREEDLLTVWKSTDKQWTFTGGGVEGNVIKKSDGVNNLLAVLKSSQDLLGPYSKRTDHAYDDTDYKDDDGIDDWIYDNKCLFLYCLICSCIQPCLHPCRRR